MIWLTSDLHLGHAMVANLRGFDNVAEHDKTILAPLLRIPSTDTLWILGDIALGGWKDNIVQLQDVRCTKHVVLGNHDRPHPSMSSAQNHIDLFKSLGGFDTVQTQAALNHNGIRFLLSHFPYSGDHGEERFNQWRLRDQGNPIIHGHTHSNNVLTLTERGTKQIHVGVDSWNLCPVPLNKSLDFIFS